MIVHASGGRLRFVTQQDHAAFAAELLSLWRSDGLPGHPGRAALLLATREHDNGWRELDAAPPVDLATGRAHDVMTLPRELRHELWRRGVARLLPDHPLAALLVTLHALRVLAEPTPDDERSRVLGELAARRDELLATTIVSAATVAALDGWLDLADRASLAICSGWEEPFAVGAVRCEPRPGALALDPFPLAGTTTFRIACRYLPDRRFGGDADLGITLATARWEAFAVRVVAA